MSSRLKDLSSLCEVPLDILVIGGGIVGAGVARDAALRGLRVGLIEQSDFASGTSSRSSRLLHGGIRYLAQGRLGLVREASVEKAVLRKIAPHLAEPLAFVFPTYRGLGWPLWQLRIGVKIYDLLCSGGNLGQSRGLGRRETLDTLQGLKAEGLRGAVRYYDGLTSDSRLVLDTIKSASQAGAFVSNYVRYVDASRVDGLWHCTAVDGLHDASMTIKARAIVNATGPWADGLSHGAVKLRLTKGIHIVVERSRVRFEDAVVITAGKRILFIIPWGERAIVGTTDTDYDGPPEEVRVDEEDIRYLLDAVNSFFPSTALEAHDVISAWAGLRPLLGDSGGHPSDISRSHEIYNPTAGWWDVAGGKLTTYRLMAEQAVDQIVKSKRLAAGPCRTASVPLLKAGEGRLLSGTMPPEFTRENVEYFCNHEWVVHLDDLMLRRTSWHYYYRDAVALAERAAIWMAESLGWNEEERAHELARYHAYSSLPLSTARQS